MEQISGADLLAIRSQAAMADDYTTLCHDNTDRLTQAYLALQVENVRLQDALKKANDQAEHFERLWYLRGDALEWYRDEAKALAKNLEGGAHTNAVLASVTVLALDAGRRADTALGHNAQLPGPEGVRAE